MGVKVRQKTKGKGNPWWVFITHNGKRTSRKVGDKKAAEAVANTIRAKLQLGEFGFDEKKVKSIPTFKLFAEGFMDTYSAMNHKKSTQDSYRSVLDLHLYPFFEDMSLDHIRRKDVKDFLYQKQQEGLSPGTVRIIKAYLSCILTQAVDDELILANPAARTGRYIQKQEGNAQTKPLTWDETTLFEKEMQNRYPSYYPFFLCALRTGMREGELIALKPGDIDFNGGFIEVERNCVRGEITTPKNGKTRMVDMSTQLARVLKSHITNRKKDALKKGWGEPPEWLFYNENGGMVDPSNLRKRIFYKCLEKAGLRRTRIHDLRHTYATLRIQAGHNIADVSKQLGHHSIKITIDTYYHWIPGSNKSEVDQLDSKTAPICTLSAPSHDNSTKKGAANLANPL
ncbi:MAG: site-specific integrase [Desulfobacterales bacterium]